MVLLTCGNTLKAARRELLRVMLPRALELVAAGEPLIEIAVPGSSPEERG